ncbi:MAG TPA: T9SS type A sorting domain-containing protein [Candidatus Kryptonia bacterium]
MKKFISILALGLFIVPISLQAQWTANVTHGDTTYVAAVDNTMAPVNDALSSAIMGDTTAAGARVDANRVYVLERGMTYFNTIHIASTGYHLMIVGQPATADSTLPVIQLAPNQSANYDDRVIDAYGDMTLKYVWILAWHTGGGEIWQPVYEESNNTNIWIDHCVFEWSQGPFICIQGSGTNTHLTNDLFRNSIDPGQWWAGRVIYHIPGVTVDSLIEVNNTAENVGFGWLQTQNDSMAYYLCDHNTMVNCAKFVWLGHNFHEAYFGNNLVVNGHFTGERFNDRPGQDPDGLIYGQGLGLDTLVIGGVTTNSSDPEELARIVHYENNATYLDTTFLYPFYAAYNDTVTTGLHGLIQAEPIMNARTASMFTWHPHFIYKNNLEDASGTPSSDPSNTPTEYLGINPGFTKPMTNGPDMLTWLTAMFHGASDGYWGYDPDSLQHPGIDVAQNLTYQYSNSSGTTYPSFNDDSYPTSSPLYTGGVGGYPIGDLNWFPTKIAAYNAAGGWASVDQPLLAIREVPNKVVPSNYTLGQNYPNPFNPATQINYSVPQKSYVTLKIFNVLGQEVATVFSGVLTAGNYVATFDGSKLASGVYFYRLQAGSVSIAKKMILMK